MSMLSRSRNGIRNLSRALSRACNRSATIGLGGMPRSRRSNGLRLACRLVAQYLRLAKRMAKEDPHLFGPHAQRYFLETLELERYQQEIDIAVQKVYGPPAPGEPARGSTLWTDRYYPLAERRKIFLKSFNEHYPSKRTITKISTSVVFGGPPEGRAPRVPSLRAINNQQSPINQIPVCRILQKRSHFGPIFPNQSVNNQLSSIGRRDLKCHDIND